MNRCKSSGVTHAAARSAGLVVAINAGTTFGAAAMGVDKDGSGLHRAWFDYRFVSDYENCVAVRFFLGGVKLVIVRLEG